MTLLISVVAAIGGTVSFSLLFGVPTRYYPYCGLIGGAGWGVYSILIQSCTAPTAVAAVCGQGAVPGYHISDFRHISAGTGSRGILDRLLYCDK